MINLDALIRQANDLEPLPASTTRLAGLVGRDDQDLRSITDVITYDPALTMRLLRAANSAFSGSAMVITNVQDAIMRLGTAQVLSLSVGSHARKLLDKALPEFGLNEHDLWRHSVTSALAAEILPSVCQAEIRPESFTAALLHDIGKLVLQRFLTPEIQEFLQRAIDEGSQSPLHAEMEVLNVHHGELGGIVAQHWRLPDNIVKGIIYHHTPEEIQNVNCDAVYLANLVSHSIHDEGVEPIAVSALLDGVIQRLGITNSGLSELVEIVEIRLENILKRYDACRE